MALWALAAAAGLFVLTYLPGYRRHARKILEAPQPNPSGPTRLQLAFTRAIDRRILRTPVQIAVFHFISQTITRSMKHRLFLATYAGCGGALAVATFGSLRLPLTLSFILISALRAAFNFPSELGANWAFQVSERRHVRTARRHAKVDPGVRDRTAPSVAGNCGARDLPVDHGTLSPGFRLALSVLLMELMFLGFHKAPFTCAYLPGKINLVGLSVIYVFGFTMYSRTMASLEGWMASQPLAIAAFFAAAALAMWRSLTGGPG